MTFAVARQPTAREPNATGRLQAIDWMRGLVMILMALDHSSDAFNRGRLFTDAAFLYRPGTPLPAAQFFTRWVTHLCAPTFLFLAGAGLAFTVDRLRAAGARPREVDRYILVRGTVIAMFELWISYFVMPKGEYLLQVLYGIGSSYVAMAALRRLPDRAAFAAALLLVTGSEAVVVLATRAGRPPLPLALTFTGGEWPHVLIGYPTIPWLAVLLFGWCGGRWWLTHPAARARVSSRLVVVGIAALALFVVLRAANGYGNMRLPRENGSLVQWLHVSKYPPGLGYVALELGIMAIVLAAAFAYSRRRSFRPHGIALTLGRTPMLFYLLHFPLLILTARALDVEHRLGLGMTYFGAAAVVAVLYPVCRWYRGYKAGHRAGWPRYI
jgi:uncharacterized membrane protein